MQGHLQAQFPAVVKLSSAVAGAWRRAFVHNVLRARQQALVVPTLPSAPIVAARALVMPLVLRCAPLLLEMLATPPLARLFCTIVVAALITAPFMARR